MAYLCATVSRISVGKMWSLGGGSLETFHLICEPSPLRSLAIVSGYWLGPHLGCLQKYLHVTSPRGFSTWPTWASSHHGYWVPGTNIPRENQVEAVSHVMIQTWRSHSIPSTTARSLIYLRGETTDPTNWREQCQSHIVRRLNWMGNAVAFLEK